MILKLSGQTSELARSHSPALVSLGSATPAAGLGGLTLFPEVNRVAQAVHDEALAQHLSRVAEAASNGGRRLALVGSELSEMLERRMHSVIPQAVDKVAGSVVEIEFAHPV